MEVSEHLKQVQYLIKYKGYPHSENTWEPIENLSCPEMIAAFEAKIQKRRSAGKVEETPFYFEIESVTDKRINNGKVRFINGL